MDFTTWGLDDPSTSWRTLKSHYEEVEEEEIEEMEDDGAVYPCPYCSEDFDDAELVEYHIREAHPSKSDYDSETCPVCAARIRTDMVEHLIARHRSSLDMEQLLKLVKAESYSDSSLYGEQYRASSRTSSPEAEAAFGKLLSFICEVPPANEVETVQSNLSTSVVSSLEKFPNEEGVERSVHPSPTLEEKAADKEARSRCEFAQALTLSSFFDMDF
ncbi:protein DEHYDRATION-INDUCED 19 homolog 2-like isoform X2 [Punica granatum]|uniref:Protein DEHYDRATION-INDUCED 19 homolog 2-like isoform X2 n=1 Tax=Punica granatum TaxID=22663 RepID=A0A6P8E831_PUNGR|nr:protein DEHYDRATION-INDUCED 19 homolog 2-like isoform X2 [Punica granatum]